LVEKPIQAVVIPRGERVHELVGEGFDSQGSHRPVTDAAKGESPGGKAILRASFRLSSQHSYTKARLFNSAAMTTNVVTDSVTFREENVAENQHFR
jgi:hypothetical protein